MDNKEYLTAILNLIIIVICLVLLVREFYNFYWG